MLLVLQPLTSAAYIPVGSRYTSGSLPAYTYGSLSSPADASRPSGSYARTAIQYSPVSAS
jgi:hypothetical protein